MNASQLEETVCDLKTRTLKRITVQDAEEASKMFDICMGKNSQLRRDLIEEFADMYEYIF